MYVCVCVVLTVVVSVGVGVVGLDGGDGVSEVGRGGGGATAVVSGGVMISEEGEEEEGEGEGGGEEKEGVAEERTSKGEGVDAMRLGVSTTVEFSMPELSLKKSPELFVILSMSVTLSIGSTEGVGEMVGDACVAVGLGTEDVLWARMTGHRTRRRRRRGEGEESSSDRTIFNLQRGGEGEECM